MAANMLLTSDKIHNYFATINPIASKIQSDLDVIKSKYSQDWNNLDLDEQINIINEAIFNSEISLKYFDYFTSSNTSRSITPILSSKLQTGHSWTVDGDTDHYQKSNKKSIYNYNGKDLSTYCKLKTGRKFLHDDTFGGFRDEHSAPFSFKSKSQVNLNIFPASEMSKVLLPNKCTNSSNINNRTEHKNLKSYNPPTNKTTATTNNQIETANLNLDTVLSASNLMKHNDVTNSIRATNIPEGDVINSNFFSKFILKSNIIFDGRAEGNEDDEEVLVNFERISSSSMPSEEEIDERNIEIKSLLRNNELRKDYDFLANW